MFPLWAAMSLSARVVRMISGGDVESRTDILLPVYQMQTRRSYQALYHVELELDIETSLNIPRLSFWECTRSMSSEINISMSQKRALNFWLALACAGASMIEGTQGRMVNNRFVGYLSADVAGIDWSFTGGEFSVDVSALGVVGSFKLKVIRAEGTGCLTSSLLKGLLRDEYFRDTFNVILQGNGVYYDRGAQSVDDNP